MFHAVQGTVTTGCSLGYVANDATLLGFPLEDECEEMSA